MTDIAIHVENLSKLYRIGKAQQRHDTLRDTLVATLERSNVPTFQRKWYGLLDQQGGEVLAGGTRCKSDMILKPTSFYLSYEICPR